jgi:hypothetical protein
VIFGQWVFHRSRGEHKLGLALAAQMEKISKARNDVRAECLGRYAGGLTRLSLGDFVAARALLERCDGLADPALRSAALQALRDEDPVVARAPSHYALMLAFLASTLAHLGYIDQARLRLNDALLEARQLKRLQTLAEVLNIASTIDLITGSPEMQRHAEEALALSTEHGFPVFWLGQRCCADSR